MTLRQDEVFYSLQTIRSKAKYILRDTELEWLDQEQTEPTNAEIEAGWLAYKAKVKAEAEAKAGAKTAAEAKLEALGLTPADLKALGL